MVKLFVGGFPLDIEEIELVKLFAVHGDVSTVKIVRNKQTKICKGYAFIEMLERKDAENAVAILNGTVMEGKALTVNINEEPIFKNEPFIPKRYFVTPAATRSVEQPQVIEKKKRPRRTA
ncbi:RNA recognition motif. (a.k.a. RRM, RBD, or RNP domain) [Mucilaginibacter pineti]|uniref:RNA recognition motif. (A.k.a. RRM, RBD, or RNP domain) n=1 Tax=Mucilaginibacter pineti TaxID=1391627 RepID=A0A1G7GCE1_9SPHI|nr:RNA-binding protein [Mucilaginibacter pineti]SDE85808.1 RNA recognition motif. (a.k.a. RRM, RBD, or RNP domain) [Mucilaginibacter pineti]